MAWYSILPDHLTFYETWLIRLFLLLAVVNISPWVIAILYDLILYIGRRIQHEIPFVGGRARGYARPRATSLRERARRISFKELIGGGSPASARDDQRADVRRRHQQNQHSVALSEDSIPEETDKED